MANGFQGPPAVDFYSMLSGLGDTMQQNAVKREQSRIAGVRAGAYRDFTALDPTSPEYGQQALTLARRVGAEGDTEGAGKFIQLAQHAGDQARAQRNADRQYNLSASNAARSQANADREWNYNPIDDHEENAARLGLKPGTPEHTYYLANGKVPDSTLPDGGGLSLTPIYGRDKDGNTVIVQPSKSGKAVVAQLPEGVSLNGYDDATIKSDAERLNAGDDTVIRKYDKKGQGRVDLLRLQTEANNQRLSRGQAPIDITQNIITMQGDKARERAAGTMEGRMAPASVEAQGAFKIAENAMDNLPRTQYVPVNKILQMGQTAWSDPNLKAAAVAVNTAVMTYSRAIAPTGVGTVDSQQHAREILATADGPAATKAAFAQLAREVDMAHASPGIAREYFAAARKARSQGLPAPQMPEYQPHQPNRMEPPPEAVQALKQDPRRAADFDAWYGAGTAKRVLSGGQ